MKPAVCFGVGGGLAVAIALACALSGCSERTMTIDNSSGAPRELSTGQDQLVARANSPVADIPVPVGFDLKESASEAQVTGNVRYVSHTYTGRKDKDRVARFYREHMQANHRWRLDFIRNANGVWRMHFAKGNERCSITISDNMWGTTTIYCEIFPVASGSP